MQEIKFYPVYPGEDIEPPANTPLDITKAGRRRPPVHVGDVLGFICFHKDCVTINLQHVVRVERNDDQDEEAPPGDWFCLEDLQLLHAMNSIGTAWEENQNEIWAIGSPQELPALLRTAWSLVPDAWKLNLRPFYDEATTYLTRCRL